MQFILDMLFYGAATTLIAITLFVVISYLRAGSNKAQDTPVAPTLFNLEDIEYSIEYASEGMVRAERNGMSESAAIVKINSDKHYLSIYDSRKRWPSKSVITFLEIPYSLSAACSDAVFQPLVEKIQKEIEIKQRRPLILDLTKCREMPNNSFKPTRAKSARSA